MIRALPSTNVAASPQVRILLLVLVACLATAPQVGRADPSPAQVAAVPPDRSAAYVDHLAGLINAYRARSGLAPLVLAPELNALAGEHSAVMARTRRLSHEGFRDRFDRTDARICVENVGVNFAHPEAQLAGWQASPGHHRNLLEPKVARMGLATVRSFVTFFACS